MGAGVTPQHGEGHQTHSFVWKTPASGFWRRSYDANRSARKTAGGGHSCTEGSSKSTRNLPNVPPQSIFAGLNPVSDPCGWQRLRREPRDATLSPIARRRISTGNGCAGGWRSPALETFVGSICCPVSVPDNRGGALNPKTTESGCGNKEAAG